MDRSCPRCSGGLLLAAALMLAIGLMALTPGVAAVPASSPLPHASPSSSVGASGSPASSPSAAIAVQAPAGFSAALQAVLPHLHGPAQGLPNLTSTNITGFEVNYLSVGTTLSSANAVQMNTTVGHLPSGGTGEDDFLFSLVGDIFSTNVSAFVGYAVANEDGISGGIPLFLILNGTTLQSCGFGGSILTPGTAHDFTMEEAHGYWWTFLEDGSPMTGSLLGSFTGLCTDPSTNGTAEMAETSLALETLPTFAWLIPASNITGLTAQTVQTVAYLGFPGTGGGAESWSDSLAGVQGIAEGVGVAGYLQNALIPPDSLQISPALPVQADLTVLWDSSDLPQIGVAESGLPTATPGIDCGTTVPFTVWTNDTSSSPPTGTAATLTENASLGGTFRVVGVGPLVGETELEFTAPLSASAGTDVLTFEGTEADSVAGEVSVSVPIQLTPLNVVALTPAAPVSGGGTMALSFQVTTTAGTPIDPAETPTVTLYGPGVVLVSPGNGRPTGTYNVTYEANITSSPSRATVVLSAGGPGYISASGTSTLSVWPDALAISPPASTTLYAGEEASSALTITSPSPPGVSTVSWSVSLQGTGGADVLASPLQVSTAPEGAVVTTDLLPTYVGPVWYFLNVSATGYNSTSTSWTDTVLGNVSVEFEGAAPSVVSGGAVELSVDVVGPGNVLLADVPVVWTVASGSLGNAGSKSVDAYSNGEGVSEVAYHAPSGLGLNAREEVQVEASNPPYEASGYASQNVSVLSSSGANPFGLSSSSAPFWAILVLIIVGVVLAIYFGRRSKEEWESGGAATSATLALGVRPGSGSDEEAPSPPSGDDAEEPPAEAEPPTDPSAPEVEGSPAPTAPEREPLWERAETPGQESPAHEAGDGGPDSPTPVASETASSPATSGSQVSGEESTGTSGASPPSPAGSSSEAPRSSMTPGSPPRRKPKKGKGDPPKAD